MSAARPAFAAALLALAACAAHAPPEPAPLKVPAPAQIDATVQELMRRAQVPGLALAVIQNGRIAYLRTYGFRDVAMQAPLQPDTVMYAASLTKAAFAYLVMQLVDEGRLDLDRPIGEYLPKPLPAYDKYADLAGDERWKQLTARRLLSHTSGFPNFRYFTPQGYQADAKLAFDADPGSRFGYSGEGINLMQFVIEQGLGFDVGTLMQQRVFDRFGMDRSSMVWREDFAANLAIGYDEAGAPLGHKQRQSVRAAGSLDTTPADYAKLLAGLQRGEGLSAAARAEMLRPQVRIDTVQQFPPWSRETTADNRGIELSYGLGWGLFRSPRGAAFFKEGHDDGTNNYALCLDDAHTCLLLMSNSSNGEGIFKYIADAVLGETCLPWFWSAYIPYDHPELRRPEARAQPHPPCGPVR
ncbi:MAG: serine hydrolase domain-containing protein [Solimonas sp.]